MKKITNVYERFFVNKLDWGWGWGRGYLLKYDQSGLKQDINYC